MTEMVQVTRRSAEEYSSLTGILLDHRYLDNTDELPLEVLRRIISERNMLISEFKEHQGDEWAKTMLNKIGNKRIILDCGLRERD